jgi:NDP-sugar pyrophosphorylase family protein
VKTSEPTLVIMAAGMGSRFGGLKQMTPVDAEGHFIIDFSLFDAWRAGFRRVVFIIKKELEESFRERIGNRMERYFHVDYVFQELTKLPEGYAVPEGRVKPWGTAHAVACCRGVVDGPFAVINADDFYGRTAYSTIYDFLKNSTDEHVYSMVGYQVRNTVTEHGSVARGVCEERDGYLTGVTERTKIFKKGGDAEFTEDGEHFTFLPGDTTVSMNFWGFTAGLLDVLWARFPAFLDENLPKNPLKCEYFLPFVVNSQLADGSARVRMLHCDEAWYGVTYKDDLQSVCDAIADMKRRGVYEEELWK